MIASRPFGMSPRPTRRRSTETVDSPQETLDTLAETGLLGLTTPDDLRRRGGSGRVRGGGRAPSPPDASSAMIYLMHVCAAQVTLAGRRRDSDASGAWPRASAWARSRSANAGPGATSGRRSARSPAARSPRRSRSSRARARRKRTSSSTRPEGTRSRWPPASTCWRRRPGRRGRSCVGRVGAPWERERADDVLDARRRRDARSARRARAST